MDRNSEGQSDIVNIDCDAVNRYRELGSLAPLAVVLLAEDLSGKVATGAIGAVEGARECLQHIWRVDLEFGRHPESAVAANWLERRCHDEATAIGDVKQASMGRKKWLLHWKKLSGARVQDRLIERAVHH
jgi:hypothetical protein